MFCSTLRSLINLPSFSLPIILVRLTCDEAAANHDKPDEGKDSGGGGYGKGCYEWRKKGRGRREVITGNMKEKIAVVG